MPRLTVRTLEVLITPMARASQRVSIICVIICSLGARWRHRLTEPPNQSAILTRMRSLLRNGAGVINTSVFLSIVVYDIFFVCCFYNDSHAVQNPPYPTLHPVPRDLLVKSTHVRRRQTINYYHTVVNFFCIGYNVASIINKNVIFKH